MQDGKAIHEFGQRFTPARVRKLLLRKLWLPRFIYEALPYLYLLCGFVALASAIHTPDWRWILPSAILTGLICLHAGIAVLTMRHRLRRRRRSPNSGE